VEKIIAVIVDDHRALAHKVNMYPRDELIFTLINDAISSDDLLQASDTQGLGSIQGGRNE
jgi:hypothetical protein